MGNYIDLVFDDEGSTEEGSKASANSADAIGQPEHSDAEPCFACGHRFMRGRGDGLFCSTGCRDYFDAGAPPYRKPEPPFDLPTGTDGFIIRCQGCGKRFDSKGLRYCSQECRKLALNSDSHLPRCLFCERVITRRRRQSEFCSDNCRKADWRKRRKNPAEASKIIRPVFATDERQRDQQNQGSKLIDFATDHFANAPLNIVGGGPWRWPGTVGLDEGVFAEILNVETGNADASQPGPLQEAA